MRKQMEVQSVALKSNERGSNTARKHIRPQLLIDTCSDRAGGANQVPYASRDKPGIFVLRRRSPTGVVESVAKCF